MATLLHFLRSLTLTLLSGFLLSVGCLGLLLGSLMLLSGSPVAVWCAPVYVRVDWLLTVFGGGDRIEGIIAIALTVSIVTALLHSFSSYKRSQRSTWHLAVSSYNDK
ncbi:MAG: hypothetical protein WA885_09275 [Phormidesmis sp.]